MDEVSILEKDILLETDADTRYWKEGRPAKFADVQIGDKLRTKTHGAGKGARRIEGYDLPASTLGVFLNGDELLERDEHGRLVTDDSFLLMFNPSHRTLDFVVPVNHGRQWEVVVDTALPEGVPPGTGPKVQAGDRLTLVDRSMTVLQRPV